MNEAKQLAKNIQTNFYHGTHQEFVDYYAKNSLSESSIQRMQGIFDCINRNLNIRQISGILEIADIGCNTGMLSMMWAREKHSVHALDVNAALLEIARKRAHQENLDIDFHLGSATALPWPDNSMDVCIAPELLEHVEDWRTCLQEFVRILKPNGVLFISTSNKLCPKQEEFNLPLYSWYPASLKRHYESLAKSTRPEIAGYAIYPAVNWFSFYQLRDELSKMGMLSFDRFDVIDQEQKTYHQKMLLALIRKSKILRWFAHVATPGLLMLAVKNR